MQLVVLQGNSPGAVLPLKPGSSFSLGRDPASTYQLKDSSVSRLHAVIEQTGGAWRIKDNGSLNGTLVNGQPIQQGEIQAGDLIRIGEFLLIFCSDDAEGIDASQLIDNTRVRRLAGEEKRRFADSPIGADSTSAPIRKLTFLYRLSRETFRTTDVDQLFTYALRSSMDVIGAAAGKVALRSIGGRLRSIIQGDLAATFDADHLLLNWVIERDEALLLGSQSDSPLAPKKSAVVDRGASIVVPIPSSFGACGAIHLIQPEGKQAFTSEDLEFMVSVAQQLGMATEWLQRLKRVETVNERLREQLRQTAYPRMVGECEAIQALRNQLSKVATTNTTTLILGESGTGKEIAARCVHDQSPRRDGPFVAVNCAAFSETLLESELFGHERGAFTGAEKQRIGQFERANGGTIFLDEIGEMSLNCQAKVLRLLEGQPYERVGGTTPIQTDVRIVAATHRDLESMVATKLFREDLWFRLRVVELRMPPLRERGADILILADFLLDTLSREMGVDASFSEAASQALLTHSWPGNVRELRNAIERALVLCASEQISPDDLGLRPGTKPVAEASEEELVSLAEVEQRYIERVLKHTGGNKTQACEILKIPRTSLYNKLKR